MKRVLKIVSAGKFTEDQERIYRRVQMVLLEHGLLVAEIKRKVKNIKLRAI